MRLVDPTQSPPQLDRVFAALADPTRRAILQRLSAGDARLGQVADPFRMSQPAISKHVRVLENAGLISPRRSRQQPLRLESAPLAQAARWLADFRDGWNSSLDQLGGLLSELQSLGRNESGE